MSLPTVVYLPESQENIEINETENLEVKFLPKNWIRTENLESQENRRFRDQIFTQKLKIALHQRIVLPSQTTT